jgi:hypothetical protein
MSINKLVCVCLYDRGYSEGAQGRLAISKAPEAGPALCMDPFYTDNGKKGNDIKFNCGEKV